MIASVPEMCVCDLTPAFDLSGPTISHHLRVLREAASSTPNVGARGCGTRSAPRRSASSARCSTCPPRPGRPAREAQSRSAHLGRVRRHGAARHRRGRIRYRGGSTVTR
ncbi:ArsR family transcriptional regulator [Micromonospora tarensis]|uniref:ArsR family transcriptional regulator n=1 Tax=Micromonospora tarensis TaxID=2806100 RepID=UPI002815BE83|nr:ArsR family transcriptional regulator [Micromonospora tarensis]